MSDADPIPRPTADLPITAGSFIVTVYGDMVMPRGEVLWIGSLIDICARIGISENLVRTAVSRLVAADRLQGTRVGRRSFYRLAPAARAEFADAARRLYARNEPSGDWLVMLHPDMPDHLARRYRMARMGGDLPAHLKDVAPRRRAGVIGGAATMDRNTIASHLVAEIAAEGQSILDEGIAARASDIDLVEIHGHGFSRWRGGPILAGIS